MQKLIYLIWDHPPEGSNDWHDAIVGEPARLCRLLAPRARAAGVSRLPA